MTSQNDPRLSLQEALEMVSLSPAESHRGLAQRFMSTRTAYLPGIELSGNTHKAAFGGHVYGQATLAVCRAWRDLEDQKGVTESERLGLHTIHGYFTAAGLIDRPFIYEVTPVTASRSFSTLSVSAYQPAAPSTSRERDHFPLTDASLPRGPISFTAICSFKSAEAHSGGVSTQDDAPQKRFASILASRRPQDWPPAPIVDIDAVRTVMEGADQVGTFPIVDMKKVDMTAFNEGRAISDRVELVLYRLLKPLPSDGADGWDANAHIVAHAYTVDRNGLLMAGNHLGFGWSLGKVASLSYSIVLHVNAEEAVMRYGEDEWWVQEATFPRAGAGRGIVMSRIWSPNGVHVATEYQDGLIRTYEERAGKL